MDGDKDLDAYAQKQGFKNYVQMKAFLQRRSESLRQNNTVPGGGAAPTPGPSATPAPAQQQQAAPGGLFGWLANVYHNATGF